MRRSRLASRVAAGNRGFTVLELLVALVIGALAVLLAHRMIGEIADGASRARAEAKAAGARANAVLELRLLFGQFDMRPDAPPALLGDASSLRVSTWCPRPGGWPERCDVSLRVREVEGRGQLIQSSDLGDTLALPWEVERAPFRYLRTADGEDRWETEWSNPLSLPRALGVLAERDTLILLVATRG